MKSDQVSKSDKSELNFRIDQEYGTDLESRPDLESDPDPGLSFSVVLLTASFHQSLDSPTLITTFTAVVVCSAWR